MSKRPQEADVEFIKALAELLRENDLTEIEVNRDFGEDDSLSVRVAREIAAPATIAAPVPAYHVSAPQHSAPPPAGAPAAASAASDPSDDPGVVPSPMVGTVYLQAEPGSPAFVKLGDIVEEGQTILIIEAMKTMNQIPAPRAGRVKRILVEDGSPVEFGAPLIILE
ncbi:MAG: acetyl-CoA carboxylase biotin carboxyl carrier protein [Rhodobacteraceae bacterium]|nr:acetyl-CoA carboxylase biotin carboxyl carrier protein [Paracoccaceae bacterium]